MNRHDRRAANAKGDSGTSDPTMTHEAMEFSARIQDAVQMVIAESASLDVADAKHKTGLAVQGLGTAAAAFAMAVGSSEKNFVEVMGLYFRQVKSELKKAQEAAGTQAKETPSIIRPDVH